MEHCASGRSCVWWVEMYLKDCVCGVRDYVSLCFGLISIFSWAIAEIPQIVTNFKSGSTEGLSLAFLMAWVVGDVFNLIGCLLVPTTLPTQFYTAVLYTITTVVLVLQSLYYGHIYKWWKSRKIKSPSTDCASKDMSGHTEPVNVPKNIDNSAELAKKLSNGTAASNLPIPTISPSSQRSIGRNIYYMSARSLASSHTPTLGSYISASSRGSGRSGPSFTLNQSSLDDEGLLASNGSRSPKNSKSTLRSVAATVFVVVGLHYFHLHANNSFQTFDSTRVDSRASVLLTGRKVLQEAVTVTVSDLMISEQSTSLVGTSLGWIMAAIYMGGRLPQIWKNVQRGSVEGLNPMMFMFALIGNATYAGSILVRTLEWKKLKSDMPWLVDAGVCVLLDCFILAQFIYCKRRKHHADHEDNINADYEAINLVLDDQILSNGRLKKGDHHAALVYPS